MKTKTFVPVEEYLHTDYSPDCDYVDGEFAIAVELRVQVSATRYRVPDVCLARAERPMPQIFHKPPLLVIEILSPEDRFSVLEKKIHDYLAFGIPNLWVIDPWERRAFIYTREGRVESEDPILRTADGEIVLPLAEIFAQT